jgi:phosphoribosyl 1,2-cyclic phosphate phosphodiesterase
MSHIIILGCGTSTGVPVPACECSVCLSGEAKNHRTRSSIAVFFDNAINIIVDTSSDFRQQVLREKIKKIDAILYTHQHSDHILGIEDIRGYNFATQKNMPIYATEKCLSHIKKNFDYIFEPDLNYLGGPLPQIESYTFDYYQTLEIFNNEIKTFELQHGRIAVAGFIFGKVAYATDCHKVPERTISLWRDLAIKTLIIDGLQYKEHKAHLTISQAIQVAEESGAEKIILTHTNHTLDYSETNAKLPAGVELAFDGMRIEF